MASSRRAPNPSKLAAAGADPPPVGTAAPIAVEGARWRAALLDALALSLGVGTGTGLARFAYALLLPAMRDDLGWTYTMAGAMNTANAVGYLLGALLAAPVALRLGARSATRLSLLAVVAALFASSLTGVFELLLALRFAAGLAGAVTFIAGGVLTAHLATAARGRAGLIFGVFYSGAGSAIVVSALLVPPLLDLSGWRAAWIAMAALGVVTLLVVHRRVGRLPEPIRPVVAGEGRWAARPLLGALTAYFLFGLGYVSYMTFVIAYIRNRGEGTLAVSLFWAMLGLAVVAAGPLWAPVISRDRGGRSIAATMAVVTLGAALPLLSTAPAVMFASGLVFGLSFVAVVTSVGAFVHRMLPPPAWSSGIATFTVIFALGQCLGPLASGALADLTGGLDAGLLLSAAELALGSLAALVQPARSGDRPEFTAKTPRSAKSEGER